MFHKFNEAARRAAFFSRYEAGALGERVIDTEHLLLGVIRQGGELVERVWETLGVDVRTIRARYPAGESSTVASSAALPLAEQARKVLEYALHEAEGRQAANVGPQHLLLAMLRVPECRAARELAEAGVTYHALAEALGTEA